MGHAQETKGGARAWCIGMKCGGDDMKQGSIGISPAEGSHSFDIGCAMRQMG